MSRMLLTTLGTVLGLLLASACRPAEAPLPTQVAPPVSKELPSKPQADWQQKWDNTLAEAKKEGTVSLYAISIWGPGLRTSLIAAFKAKYGIDLEFTPLAAGELSARVQTEQRAGLYLADVFGAGATNFLLQYKPDGIVGRIQPMLMLPEVLDPKAWAGGELFDYDKEDHMSISMLRVVGRTIVYNKDLVREDEISSYKDLLKPRFKGQVTMINPLDPAAGTVVPNHLARVYGWDEGIGFFRELMTKQEPVIFSDARLHTETVARGKYAVMLGGSGQYKADFITAGAPLAIKIPAEGDYVTTSFGAVAVAARPPHPNAAAIFVNWLLTKEGQSVFAKGAGGPSRRLDASTEGVNPIFIPSPGEKMHVQSVEFDSRTPRVIEAVKGILAEAGK
ncbi:MAG: ABC transporter substrate-binding protein [Chloroflexi bacterium]|nr:ABC transporter substrate-binding protein [Chloroflexota bacterium]